MTTLNFEDPREIAMPKEIKVSVWWNDEDQREDFETMSAAVYALHDRDSDGGGYLELWARDADAGLAFRVYLGRPGGPPELPSTTQSYAQVWMENRRFAAFASEKLAKENEELRRRRGLLQRVEMLSTETLSNLLDLFASARPARTGRSTDEGSEPANQP